MTKTKLALAVALTGAIGFTSLGAAYMITDNREFLRWAFIALMLALPVIGSIMLVSVIQDRDL